MIDGPDARTSARAAAIVLGVTGGLCLLAGLLVVAGTLPAALGSKIPGTYAYLLVVLAVLGGGLHLMAGWLTYHRRALFWTVLVTLAGMVLVQVSLPLDALALVLLALGRGEFASSGTA